MDTQTSKDKGTEKAVRDVWMVLETHDSRIQGIVKIPAHTRCRRLYDILWNADRGACGVFQLQNATIYDLKTNEVKARFQSLGVNKSCVLYTYPLSEELDEQETVVELREQEFSIN